MNQYTAKMKGGSGKIKTKYENKLTYISKYGKAVRDYRLMVISLLRQRNGELCGICEDYLGDAQIEIDHIIPVKQGGTSDASNIQLAHKSCNRLKKY